MGYKVIDNLKRVIASGLRWQFVPPIVKDSQQPVTQYMKANIVCRSVATVFKYDSPRIDKPKYISSFAYWRKISRRSGFVHYSILLNGYRTIPQVWITVGLPRPQVVAFSR